MNEQSAMVIDAENPEDLLKARNITLQIDAGKFALSTPARAIGDGDDMIWNVGIIPGYTVVIDVNDANLDPAALSFEQGIGDKFVSGVVKAASTAPVNFTVSYSVSLKDKTTGVKTALEHYTYPLTSSPTILTTDPALAVDRMGSPPDPPVKPIDPPRHEQDRAEI
jgi:hypothetical protein